MAKIVISFDDKNYTFDLDNETEQWAASNPADLDVFDEGDFPLIGTVDGKRYELYSDGTFAEVEV
jgi:hypothetical protein